MNLDELSGKLGLRFPVDTELLAVTAESGMDDALFVKVAFGVDGWDFFLSHAALSEADFSEDRRYLLGPDDDWWNPEQPASLPTAQAQLPNGEFLNVGVDRSDPARLILYLMWHQT
ncbi:MAG: hypothetical protein GY953_54860 [bacterium]|nr:hypothetical protein [bacterium]